VTGVLKELPADERTRMLYEKREMSRRDFELLLAELAEKDAEIARLRAMLEAK